MNGDLPTHYTVRIGCNPALRWCLLTPLSLFLIAGLSLALFDGKEPDGAMAGWIITGIMLPMLLLLLYLLDRTQLSLSYQGLNVRFVGVNLQTPWENVERLYLENGQCGVLTYQPMTGKGVERFAKYRDIGEPNTPPYDANARQWLAERRYVPLRGFEHSLKSGKLQAEMKHYVPNLAGAEMPKPEPKGPATPAQKRATILFVVIIVGALGLGVVLAGDHMGRVRSVIYGLGWLLGGLRVGLSAISCWRNHKVLSLVYFILAVMMALLSLVCFVPADPSYHKSPSHPLPASPAPHAS